MQRKWREVAQWSTFLMLHFSTQDCRLHKLENKKFKLNFIKERQSSGDIPLTSESDPSLPLFIYIVRFFVRNASIYISPLIISSKLCCVLYVIDGVFPNIRCNFGEFLAC